MPPELRLLARITTPARATTLQLGATGLTALPGLVGSHGVEPGGAVVMYNSSMRHAHTRGKRGWSWAYTLDVWPSGHSSTAHRLLGDVQLA